MVRDADDRCCSASTVVCDGGLAGRALARVSSHAAMALGLVAATPLLLGELALTRFDALPVALTAAAVAALLAGRSRLAAVALGLAIAVKLYPLLLVPLAAIYVLRRAGRREAAVTVGAHGRPPSPPSSSRSSRSHPPRRGSRSGPSSPAASRSRACPATSCWRSTPPADKLGLGLAGRRRSPRVARARCGAPT